MGHPGIFDIPDAHPFEGLPAEKVRQPRPVAEEHVTRWTGNPSHAIGGCAPPTLQRDCRRRYPNSARLQRRLEDHRPDHRQQHEQTEPTEKSHSLPQGAYARIVRTGSPCHLAELSPGATETNHS
jgi:hypothetical protein